MDHVGIIGLGTMGAPIAHHMIRQNRCHVVYDVNDEVMAPFADENVMLANGVADVAANADIVLLVLPGSDEVEHVVIGGDSGGLLAGLNESDVVVDMTTSSPSSTDVVERHLDERGVDMLGAPISGGEAGAKTGELTIMVGGDDTALARCQPIFESFSNEIIHVGAKPRDGHVVKLLNNFLSFSAFVLTSEAVAVGQRYGIDIEKMLDVFNVSTGRNGATQHKFPQYVNTGTYDSGAPLAILKKDLSLYSSLMNDSPPMGDLIYAIVAEATDELGSDTDHTHLYEYIRDSTSGEIEGDG